MIGKRFVLLLTVVTLILAQEPSPDKDCDPDNNDKSCTESECTTDEECDKGQTCNKVTRKVCKRQSWFFLGPVINPTEEPIDDGKRRKRDIGDSCCHDSDCKTDEEESPLELRLECKEQTTSCCVNNL